MVQAMNNSLAGLFIDLSDQSKSGRMAMEASRTGKTATIDLSSASDRLSCWLVERIFRANPDFLQHLHSVRTRYIRIPAVNGGSETYHKLNKYASQGTAVTFPVQSFVFLCIVLGVCLNNNVTERNIRALRGRVRVFGDDIIVPSTGYADVCDLLDLFGLKVNMEKSFVHGRFRESCGVDAWNGYDVTPCKPQSLTSDNPVGRTSLIDTTNNLFNKGLWYASESCRRLLPGRVIKSLPIRGPSRSLQGQGLSTFDSHVPRRNRPTGGIGWQSFVGSSLDHLHRRYNERLHREEYRVWVSLNREPVPIPPTKLRTGLLQHFAESRGSRVLRGNTLEPRVPIKLGTRVRPRTTDGLRWEPLYGLPV